MSFTDQRKLAAIMYADIVSYSRMLAYDEARTLALLKNFIFNVIENKKLEIWCVENFETECN